MQEKTALTRYARFFLAACDLCKALWAAIITHLHPFLFFTGVSVAIISSTIALCTYLARTALLRRLSVIALNVDHLAGSLSGGLGALHAG